MSNLSERVKKAKKLTFSPIPGIGSVSAGTWGSQDDYYQVTLFQVWNEEIDIADKNLGIKVISMKCEKLNNGNGKLNPMETCQGNCKHTVCYHNIGWLIDVLSRRSKTISFYEDIFTALLGKNFGGELVKVINQGRGYVWGVIKEDKPIKILSAEDNIRLMRGNEEEGID